MIQEKIIDRFIPKNIINKILSGDYPLVLRFVIFLMDITRTLRFYFKYWKFKGLQNIEWLSEYNISSDMLNGKIKKEGISGYSRLKNAEDFLIPSIESVVNYLDEIILVENGSTDSTRKKCIFLQQKYPRKIKIYQYKPEVYPLFSSKFADCPENSVHNFAYMSNWTLSKVNYQYWLKLDDDQIFIVNNTLPLLKTIRRKWINKFILTPLINVQKNHHIFVLANDNYRSAFSWLFSDIGFHPISTRIYFHSNGKTEGYVHNYLSKLAPITFLHLKLLKPDKGLKNYHKDWHEYLKHNYTSNKFRELDGQYIDLLHTYLIDEDR